jgi:hypothetical protein
MNWNGFGRTSHFVSITVPPFVWSDAREPRTISTKITDKKKVRADYLHFET